MLPAVHLQRDGWSTGTHRCDSGLDATLGERREGAKAFSS